MARMLAFILLAVVTIYGTYHFIQGDWTDVISYWRGNVAIIPALVGLSVIDVVLESAAWMWVYHRFGIRVLDRGGACAFVAGRAGLILPAQLGRLIRPDAIVKLKRARMADALKAEGVVFALDAISVVALLAALVVYRISPAMAPVAAALVIAVSLFLGNTINRLVTHTHLRLPQEFWWSWKTVGTICVGMSGWLAHGFALHVVVANLPGDMTLWDSLVFAPGAAVLGVATGLPGGIGATEGLLGVSLRLRSVPAEHLALAVAAFRLITFWIWIPAGWFALGILNRHRSRLSSTTGAGPETEGR